MTTYLNYRDELSAHGIDVHPSELHGMLVGYLCAVKGSTGEQQRAALYRDWLGSDVPEELHSLLEESVKQTDESLGDFTDFEFRLLKPGDDAPLSERVESVARWCAGFVSGFGETGRHDLDREGQSNIREALTDMSRIAGMTDEVPEGEENEADLLEIEEFVRVSTLLIYSEIGSSGAH